MAKRVRRKGTEEQVWFNSHMLCCVCQKRGDHTHHLDGNKSNTTEENLAVLCHEHHVEAEQTTKLRRKYSPGIIRKYRKLHYNRIEAARNRSVEVNDKRVSQLTQASMVEASITAAALVDLERAEAEYGMSSSGKRSVIISGLWAYSRYNNPQIAYALMEFVTSSAHYTRGNLTLSDCSSLISIAMEFFPHGIKGRAVSRFNDIAKLYFITGSHMAYDAAIHRHSLHIALDGLTLLKFMHGIGMRYGSKTIMKEVQESFDWLEGSMHRLGRTDLGLFLDLFKFYRTKLDGGDLSYPIFPPAIMRAYQAEQGILKQ